MINFLAPLLSFLLLYKYWAFFVLMFVTSAIVPLPMSGVLLATGAFASQKYFNLPLSLFVGISANILGDLFDYFLAKIYGRKILEIFHLKTPDYLERLEHQVRKNPGPTIFLTRFAGTTDLLGNLLSGFVGIPVWTFILYDVIGDFVSTGYIMVAGYFIGSSWQNFLQFFSITGWVIFGSVIVFLVVLVKLYKKNNHNR